MATDVAATAEGASDLIADSHYRVCRKIAVDNFHFRPMELDVPLVPPPERVYQPLSLKAAAATVVVRFGLHSRASLPEVRDVVQEVMEKTPAAFIIKDRSCPDVTYLRVGNFDQFPGSRDLVSPYIYSTNIIAQARNVLNFLLDTMVHTNLDNEALVKDLITKRYLPFMQLQGAHLNAVLLPPVDVQVVWLSHMLNSLDYKRFASALAPGLERVPHPVTRCLTPEQKQLAEERYLRLKKTEQPCTSTLAPNARDIVDDRMWAREFKRICSEDRANYVTDAYLFRSLKGYQRYLYLLSKHTQRIEFEGFSPPPMIDLIWHTHLLQPAVYEHDAVRLMNQVHHHKLLPRAKRTPAQYGVPGSEPKEQKLWREEFGEELRTYFPKACPLPEASTLARILALPTFASFPPPPPAHTLSYCAKSRVCTYLATFRAFTHQTFFHCKTCRMPSDEGCCTQCARRCHVGHELTQKSGNFYCDCGETAQCKARTPVSVAECHRTGACTLLVTGTKSFAEQPMWRCKTCKTPDDEGLCKACWERCHAGHVALGPPQVSAFYCDCGARCKILPPALANLD